MSSQVDTLNLLRQYPRSTVAELADIVAPDRYHSTMVRVKGQNTKRFKERGSDDLFEDVGEVDE